MGPATPRNRYNDAMPEAFHPVALRVRYAETDQMGVVHHSVYPVWFEAARTELSRAVGLPYTEWERRGVFLMVSEVHCRYRRPAIYDQEVTVWVRVSEVSSRRVVFTYRVNHGSEVLAEGETRHLLVSRTSGHPVVVPDELKASLLRIPGGDAPGEV